MAAKIRGFFPLKNGSHIKGTEQRILLNGSAFFKEKKTKPEQTKTLPKQKPSPISFKGSPVVENCSCSVATINPLCGWRHCVSF